MSLDDQGFQVGASGVERGRVTGTTRANDDDVANMFHRNQIRFQSCEFGFNSEFLWERADDFARVPFGASDAPRRAISAGTMWRTARTLRYLAAIADALWKSGS